MVFNILSVGSAVTPTVIETYFSHYLHRKSLRRKPSAHISYHEGIKLIRQFLIYASHHTVEDLQSFTSQWVPNPRWVKVDEVTIPQKVVDKAASVLCLQLGHRGINKVGGEKWWQWRREGRSLQAEWIEMRRDYISRQQTGSPSKRVMLYVHGGAYFFGSVDEHRYQMQRHARKLEARVFARMLVTLRDQGLPLPSGAILISPWVDLTHSFPSVAGDRSNDYIPAHGFMQRPSAAWPPPNTDEMEQIVRSAVQQAVDEALPRESSQQIRLQVENEAVERISVDHTPESPKLRQNVNDPSDTGRASELRENNIPGIGRDLSITLDGTLTRIKDQIHMYTTNQLISHPLVSPILQPSLGGLPPLLIVTGGSEVLRDEQVYLAHKAASPSNHPPASVYLDEYPDARETIAKWKPTDVQLQVWDDLCHVAPTLSFTRPAKYMYRSIAQFGAYVLARAQRREVDIQDDDTVSIITSGSESESDSDINKTTQSKSTMDKSVEPSGVPPSDKVGKAGQTLPPFKDHMIRQRVDRHGHIYPLDPPSALAALQMPANDIGVLKPGPVKKWLNAKQQWDLRYAKDKRKVQRQRARDMAKGFEGFGDDEVPPPSALAGRRGLHMPKEERKGRSWAMMLWSLWGSSHDEQTIERERKADREVETLTVTEINGQKVDSNHARRHSRSKSRRRTVTFTGQGNGAVDEKSPAAAIEQKKAEARGQQSGESTRLIPPDIVMEGRASSDTALPDPHDPNRPSAGGKAFPFKLGSHLQDDGRNASTITLISQGGVATPRGDETGKQNGDTIGNSEDTRLDRRVTMEDTDGVLHKRLVEQKIGEPGAKDDPATNFESKKRPAIERFETAKENI